MNRELNTCFVHFINVGRLYGLLNDKDMEPMAPLVDIWVKQGVLPPAKVPEATAGGDATPKSAGGDGGAGVGATGAQAAA